MSPPQLGSVDQIVVHQRRRVHQLDGDGRTQEAFIAIGSTERPTRIWIARGFGGKQDEQRAQPLTASCDRRVRVERERSARTRGHTLQIELGASHPST